MAPHRTAATWLPLLALPLAWLPVHPVQGRESSPPRERSVHPTASVAVPRPLHDCPGAHVGARCLPPSRCGLNQLDVDGLCIPLGEGGDGDGRRSGDLETNAHVDRLGRRVVYEHLPRLPDVPEAYARYVYPLGPPHTVSSGYDLDRPDALQRRGAGLHAVGHGAVDLPGERGEPVHVVSLRGEVGDPEVVFVGVLFGNTVVLRHVVREGTVQRTYLALHGHLEGAAPGMVPGLTVRPGTVLGYVGDSGALGIVHLHYEVRLVRPGIDPRAVDPPARLVDQEVSVPCDPRNVLPLR